MTWFERLTGIPKETPAAVRESLPVDGEVLHSSANGRSWRCGRLETPSLAELREQVRTLGEPDGALQAGEVVADVRDLHRDEANAGALFQVASQFNLLEMTRPNVTPEQGVGRYENDRTQGPACAIAAGAGTIYRNYFAPVGSGIGQTRDRQIDCLADLGAALGNDGSRLWEMRNGYALATAAGLAEIGERLGAAPEEERDRLRGLLRIGLQEDTQVTLGGCDHTVSQAYCSALPVAYGDHPASAWEPFARLVLEAAYEATLCAACLNAARTGCRRVFLTLLGGGGFGNRKTSILDALLRALARHRSAPLEVAVVSYGRSDRDLRQLLATLNQP